MKQKVKYGNQLRGFVLVSLLFVFGIAISFFTEKEVNAVEWPINLYMGLVLIFVIIVSGTVYRKSLLFKWFSGKQNTIAALSFYLIVVLLMGFIPQQKIPDNAFLYKIGFSHVLSSHVFLFSQVYLLLVLGMVTVRRLSSFNTRNIAFFINHFGLWLSLFAIGLGAGDLKNISMEINKQQPTYEGVCSTGEKSGDIGVAVQLIDFKIDFYPPKAYIIDAHTGELVYKNQFIDLVKGNKGKIGDWNINVLSFSEYSIPVNGDFKQVYEIGAAPAALVEVSNNNKTIKDQISCGSFRFPGNYIELSDNKLLVMAEPEAERYESEIKVYTKEGAVFEAPLTVGKPVKAGNWKIYQTSYDTEKGRWSEISVIELVKDPWIKIVYIGLILILTGSVYLIFTGKKTHDS